MISDPVFDTESPTKRWIKISLNFKSNRIRPKRKLFNPVR
jgi:hypothetical protein